MIATYQQDVQRTATEIIRQLVSVTTQLFGGVVGIKESADPEFHENKHLVFIVETELEPQSAAAQELDWIHQVEAIAPGWKDIRLFVRFK